jgi:hypothetical protein
MVQGKVIISHNDVIFCHFGLDPESMNTYKKIDSGYRRNDIIFYLSLCHKAKD